MEKVVMKSGVFGDKMRIRLVDPKTGVLLSDRLVSQDTEFRMGPNTVHEGPLSLEFNLNSQEDVNKAVDYLKKLKGDLPIIKLEKKVTKSKIEKMLTDKEPLLDLLKTCEIKCKTQEALINYLREFDFMFVASDVIQDLAKPEMITLRDKDLNYQFMVRRVKQAKEPANDKYDFRLVFAIKILGEKIDKVPVYLWGKWKNTLKIKWEQPKKINFKKVEKIYIFPEFMDYNDRKKWRSENRKLQNNPESQKSKFYLKYEPYIKVH